ncbi:MAG: PAN domain-containing protein [Pseudomonadota bacterium]
MRLSLLFLASALAAPSAFAADLGTYRPGTPYHSAIVPTANVCESQCAGDARCRGWNYVKAAPTAPGVCEFQSSIGSPVSSAISISGVSGTAAPQSSRIVQGATNTIRVGTTGQPIARDSITATPTRRIVREATPQITSQAAPYGSLPQQARAFQPALGGQSVVPSTRPPVQASPTAYRGPARIAPQARQPIEMTQPYPSGYPAQPMPAHSLPAQPQRFTQGRPPIGQTIAPPQPSPSQTQNWTPRMQAPAPQPMPRAPASHPVTWDTAQQAAPSQPSQPANNLYGRLHDDVVRNAPPAAASRPVTPVTQLPLAGAMPRQ